MERFKTHARYRAAMLIGCSAIAIASPSFAQDRPSSTPAPNAAQQTPAGGVDSTPTGAAEAASKQTPQASDPGEPTTDIVVTGIRRANNIAIDAKRRSTNIIDAIGSNEARALPDTTIVESLRRIPGLSVIPITDNEHPRDEAATPVIRGLGPAYNNVTIDGLPVASPGTPNGTLGSIARGVRLDILPTSMISELQVVKTFTADLDPNAVGGAVNIVTRSAFEGGGKPFFTVEGAVGHATDVGKPAKQSDPGYRFVATGSTTFGPDHIFGVTVSGNYQTLSNFTDNHATTDTVFENFYDNSGNRVTGANTGNGIPVPQQDKNWYVQDQRNRYGITGKLEARPSDQFDAYVSAGYYYFQDKLQRNELIIDGINYAKVLNQTPTSGTYPSGGVQIGFSNIDIVSRTRVLQAGLNWRPNPKSVFSLRGGYSYATYDEKYYQIKYATGVVNAAPGTAASPQVALPSYGFSYNTSQFNQSFNLSPSQYYNYANYSLLYYRPLVSRQAADKVFTIRGDYAYNRSAEDRGFGAAAGASYTDDRPKFNLFRTDLEPNTNAGYVGLAGVLGPQGAPLKYNNNGLYLLTINGPAAIAQINALPAGSLNTTNQYAFSNQDNFTHQEHTLGAYALVSYKSDAISAEAGVHYDHTRQSTVGNLLVAGVFQPTPTRSSYSYFLPSGVVTWHATRALDIRGAISQTIGRPSYDSYAARSSVTFNNNDQGNPNATNVIVNLGNPDLKPRRSNNFDLSADYVLSGRYGGILSVAGFYKDIKDEIFNASTLGYAYQGVTYINALVTTPANSSGSNIKGVEFNAIVNSLGFINPLLTGFGVSANASILEGRLKVPLTAGGTRTLKNLVSQPDNTVSASVFYSMSGLELRAAYSHQGRALRSILTDISFQDLYFAPRDQVDLSATYTLKNGLAIFAQASNVTHTRLTSLTGPNKNLLKDSYSIPTTLWVGVRFTPHLR